MKIIKHSALILDTMIWYIFGVSFLNCHRHWGQSRGFGKTAETEAQHLECGKTLVLTHCKEGKEGTAVICVAVPRAVEPKEARMKEWRELLRQWHPDKNPHRIEAHCQGSWRVSCSQHFVCLLFASCLWEWHSQFWKVATAVFQFLQKGKPMLDGSWALVLARW